MGVPPGEWVLLMASALKENGSTTKWRKIRERILIRDCGICQACGMDGNTVDHIIPRSMGGTDDEINLQCLCGACNSAKGGINRLSRGMPTGGSFFNGTRTPLTLPGLVSPPNDSKSHEND
jgi:HNH endonuclease